MTSQMKIKIPKGTVLSINNSNVFLKKSLHAIGDENGIRLTDDIIETDLGTILSRDMRSNSITIPRNGKHGKGLHKTAADLLISPEVKDRELKKKILKYLNYIFDEELKKYEPVIEEEQSPPPASDD